MLPTIELSIGRTALSTNHDSTDCKNDISNHHIHRIYYLRHIIKFTERERKKETMEP